MNDKIGFKRLSEPINIGKMTVKNRIAMAGMATGFFTKEGFLTEQAKQYYEARAKGGAGMVVVEATCVDFPRGLQPFQD
jgi:2,4-dienoyl-CoA reductase-like NADH-dependent reductase (Old Yellow Enzyme family)